MIRVTVPKIPNCDLCSDGTKAKYDARLRRGGRWAYVCQRHFEQMDCTLGMGCGQELVEDISNDEDM